MLFGVLSLLMGHWILFVAKICVKSSVFSSSRFYPCAMDGEVRLVGRVTMPRSDQFLNMSVMNKEQVIAVSHGYCPQVAQLSIFFGKVHFLNERFTTSSHHCSKNITFKFVTYCI